MIRKGCKTIRLATEYFSLKALSAMPTAVLNVKTEQTILLDLDMIVRFYEDGPGWREWTTKTLQKGDEIVESK